MQRNNIFLNEKYIKISFKDVLLVFLPPTIHES